MEDFSCYFKLDKETLKILIKESQLYIDHCIEILSKNINDPVYSDYLLEEQRYEALKIALVTSDDNSMLSTLNLNEYGTLDINKVYDKMKRVFEFNFK